MFHVNQVNWTKLLPNFRPSMEKKDKIAAYFQVIQWENWTLNLTSDKSFAFLQISVFVK